MNPYEWRINDIERDASEAKRRLHELDSLRSGLDSVERAVRETRAEADGLRDELRASQERINQLEARLDEMANEYSPQILRAQRELDSTVKTA